MIGKGQREKEKREVWSKKTGVRNKKSGIRSQE